MPEQKREDSKGIARRSLLGLAIVGSTAAGLSYLFPENEQPGSSVKPSSSPTTASPTIPALADANYVQNLKRGIAIEGHDQEFGQAFSTIKISGSEPLENYRGTSELHIALSLVGQTKELQIISPWSGQLVHAVDLPDHVGHGIDSMCWDEHRQRLYLSVDGIIWTWNPGQVSQFQKLVDVTDASTVYELQLDRQGNLWGGTYPLGAYFRYEVDNRKLRIFDRVAKDTQYIRRVELDGSGRIWLGTGSRNPRLFMLSSNQPETVQEIGLPVSMEHGFIDSIASIGRYLAVGISSVSEESILDTQTMQWLDHTRPVRLSGKASAVGSGKGYSVSSNQLYVTAGESLTETVLGPIEADRVTRIVPGPERVLVVSSTRTGVICQVFDLSARQVVAAREISLTRTSIKIHSLLGHSDGSIYVGGFKADGIAIVHPGRDGRWSSGDDERVINQIEGMIGFAEDKIYIGSYGRADLVRMQTNQDPTKRKYDRIARLSTDYSQSRPFGWAANSTSVFFGTVPDYGNSGGVLGKIDPRTDQLSWVLHGKGVGFIPHHSIIGLAADESYVYGTTSVRNGYGIADSDGPARVFKLDVTSRKILWVSSPISDAGALYAPTFVGKWIAVADLQGIALLDPETGAMKKRHIINTAKNTSQRPGWLNADIRLTPDQRSLVHCAVGKATVVDFSTATFHDVAIQDPGDRYGTRLTVGADGKIYGIWNQTSLVQFSLRPKADSSR